MTTIVRTKEQLKQAIENKEKEIVIDNDDLAKNILKYKKIEKLSKWMLVFLLASIGIGTIGLALAPVSGGSSAILGSVSSGALYSITMASGTVISVEAITAIGALAIIGSVALFAIHKDYTLEVKSNPLEVKLHKKNS